MSGAQRGQRGGGDRQSGRRDDRRGGAEKSANLERVVSNTTRSGHFWSDWIRMWMLSRSDPLEGGASATLPENHQLAAKSAARRKLPTHRKY